MSYLGTISKSDAWHSQPVKKLSAQNQAVMAVIESSARDWTLGEVQARLKSGGASWAEKSTVNRCLDSLCAAGLIDRDQQNRRKCAATGMTVTRYFIPQIQQALFN
jgi:predicted transcriptional regulator